LTLAIGLKIVFFENKLDWYKLIHVQGTIVRLLWDQPTRTLRSEQDATWYNLKPEWKADIFIDFVTD